jgi:hypothetical protein
LPEPTENMLKVGEARNWNRAIDGAFQRPANKRSDTCRDTPNWMERALSCYVLETGRSAISRRQVLSPVASRGNFSIGVLTSRQITTHRFDARFARWADLSG